MYFTESASESESISSASRQTPGIRHRTRSSIVIIEPESERALLTRVPSTRNTPDSLPGENGSLGQEERKHAYDTSLNGSLRRLSDNSSIQAHSFRHRNNTSAANPSSSASLMNRGIHARDTSNRANSMYMDPPSNKRKALKNRMSSPGDNNSEPGTEKRGSLRSLFNIYNYAMLRVSREKNYEQHKGTSPMARMGNVDTSVSSRPASRSHALPNAMLCRQPLGESFSRHSAPHSVPSLVPPASSPPATSVRRNNYAHPEPQDMLVKAQQYVTMGPSDVGVSSSFARAPQQDLSMEPEVDVRCPSSFLSSSCEGDTLHEMTMSAANGSFFATSSMDTIPPVVNSFYGSSDCDDDNQKWSLSSISTNSFWLQYA